MAEDQHPASPVISIGKPNLLPLHRAGGSLVPATQSGQVTTVPGTFATIGRDSETDQPITIGDIERRSGLYVLGKAGMGKTTLLVNLMDQDIKKGHGLFFLDPHGDAIEDLIAVGDQDRLTKDLLLLNPLDKTHSFGINLLACRDITDWYERLDTYTKARWVFYKIFEKELGEKPWFELILQNTLYVFLENQEYTIAEVPLFLTDPAFRNHLLSQVKYKLDVVDFWRKQFHQKQAEPVLTRIATFLNHDPVSHIVSQRKTTIDFDKIIAERRIVLVNLPARLAPDIKKFIGTLLINELVHAVRRRSDVPRENRHQFCIFIDEFQNFAYSDDFPVLFMEARKLGVATTVAHQERHGQLLDNEKIQGATNAAANKILFQLTVKDASEQAPEFAKEPPKEIKEQQALVISQEPFQDLLKGHLNPVIHHFVRRYLRPMHYRLQDIAEEMEFRRLERMSYQEEVALHRIDEQMLGRHLGAEKFQALQAALKSVEEAKYQTKLLQSLWQRASVTRGTIRYLNAIFIAIMEGDIKPAPGQERFSAFLREIVQYYSRVPVQYIEALTLYLSLVYGNPLTQRTISVDFAQRHGQFSDEIAEFTALAEEKTKQARIEYSRNRLKSAERRATDYINYEVAQKFTSERVKKREKNFFSGGMTNNSDLWEAPRIYMNYVWFECYQADLWELLAPYLETPFPRRHETGIEQDNGSNWIDNWISENTATLIENVREREEFIPYAKEGYRNGYNNYLKASVVESLLAFLQKYREGGLIALLFLDAAREGGWERRDVWGHIKHAQEEYQEKCMLHFPRIPGVDPLEILRTVHQLNAIMRSKQENYTLFLKSILCCFEPVWGWYQSISEGFFEILAGVFLEGIGAKQRDLQSPEEYRVQLEEHGRELENVGFPMRVYDQEIKLDVEERCPQRRRTNGKSLAEDINEVGLLRAALHERWDWFSHQHQEAANLWTTCDTQTRSYLFARACDILTYDVRIADLSFPLPALSGAERLVSALIHLYEDTKAQIIQKYVSVSIAEYRESTERELTKELPKIIYPLPVNLPPRVLSSDQIETLKNMCMNEFSQCDQNTWNASATLQVIDEFVQFCRLLSLPENHVKTRIGQFVETPANSRLVKDMSDEMAHDLMKLPRYTAYAKIIQEKGEDQIVIARKFQAQKPPSVPIGRNRDIRDRALALSHSFYCKERTQIEEELRHRQGNWRRSAASEKPAANTQYPPSPANEGRGQQRLVGVRDDTSHESGGPETMKPISSAKVEEPPPTFSKAAGKPTAPAEPPPTAEVRAPGERRASKTKTPDDEIDQALQEKFKDLLDPKNWSDLWK